MRALIADDDRLGTMILARALERQELEVAVAHDGEEAWRMWIRQAASPSRSSTG